MKNRFTKLDLSKMFDLGNLQQASPVTRLSNEVSNFFANIYEKKAKSIKCYYFIYILVWGFYLSRYISPIVPYLNLQNLKLKDRWITLQKYQNTSDAGLKVMSEVYLFILLWFIKYYQTLWHDSLVWYKNNPFNKEQTRCGTYNNLYEYLL